MGDQPRVFRKRLKDNAALELKHPDIARHDRAPPGHVGTMHLTPAGPGGLAARQRIFHKRYPKPTPEQNNELRREKKVDPPTRESLPREFNRRADPPRQETSRQIASDPPKKEFKRLERGDLTRTFNDREL